MKTKMLVDMWPRTRAPVDVHRTARVHESVMLWAFARILGNVTIEEGASIGGGTEIGRGSVIEKGARVGANCFLPSHTKVGAFAFIGPGCTFTDDRHPRVPLEGEAPYLAEPPVIEERANVGAGCVVLPGIRIGAGALVGAGSVVTRDVPPNTLWRGEPARLVEPSEDTARIMASAPR